MDSQVKAVASHIRDLDRKIRRLENALEQIANTVESAHAMKGQLSIYEQAIARILRRAWQVRTHRPTPAPGGSPKAK